jgi:Fe-S cluster biosynthesis and repair protein YggX
MKDYITNWSDKEFKAYLLLYCAYADMFEHKEEKQLIKEKVGKGIYKKVHEEFDDDNDFTRIQKIQAAAKRLNYSEEQIDLLIDETKEIFLSDGKFHHMEQHLHRQLKRLLK